MRRWLWLRFTRDGRDERRYAMRYMEKLERHRQDPSWVAQREQIKACSPHPNRVDLPPTPVESIKAQRCLDCGTPILTLSDSEDCHCGDSVDTSDLRGRGMCTHCDDVRCDAYPGACGR